MKKIISSILCVAIILGLVPHVYAKGHEYVRIKLDAGMGVITEMAIVQDGEVYLPAESYSDITRYTYYAEKQAFLIDGQTQKKAEIKIKVNTKNNTLWISPRQSIVLPDIIKEGGVLYLPLSYVLPTLNADIATISNGVVYISNNEFSLWEVLYDFDITNYTFDYAAEFADDIWLGKLSFELPNFLLDSITHFRLDRLPIVSGFGVYNDYVDIFTEYLLDDEVYLKAMGTSFSHLTEIGKIISATKNLNKSFKTVFEWKKEFDKKYSDSSKEVFTLFDVYLPYPYDLEGVIETVNAGKFSMMDALDVMEFVYNYNYQIEDHRKMLNAVYRVNNEFVGNDAERAAAKKVYNLYGEKVIEEIGKEVAERLIEEMVEEVDSINWYELTCKVSGKVLEAILPHNAMKNAADIARLSLYETAMRSARTSYYRYNIDLKTDTDVENLRLSILMALISSRSCYNVMLNTGKSYQDNLLATNYSSLISYYERQIKNINAMICMLYKVADNVKYDSFDNVDQFAKAIRKKITESGILESRYNSVKSFKDCQEVSMEDLMPQLELINSSLLETYGAEVDLMQSYYRVYESVSAFENNEEPIEIRRREQGETIGLETNDLVQMNLYVVENFGSVDEWREYLKNFLASEIIEEWETSPLFKNAFEEHDGIFYLVRGPRGYGAYTLDLNSMEVIFDEENKCHVLVDCCYFERYACIYRVDFEFINRRWIVMRYSESMPEEGYEDGIKAKRYVEEEQRLREEEIVNGVNLTNGRWYYGGYRSVDSFYYMFDENGNYYVQYVTVEDGSYVMSGTYQFDGTMLELYDGNGEKIDELIYDGEENVFRSSMSGRMTRQDYVDENGVYHEPTFEPRILERDYGN